MPIYDYKCKYCKTKKEIFQKRIEDKILYCDKCKKKSLVKLISASNFILKGKGWYKTDFKTEKNNS